MDNETIILNDKQKTKQRTKKKNNTHIDIPESKRRYVCMRKDLQDAVANRIDELLFKCNQKDNGSLIDFSSLVSHSIMLIKDSDISELQNNSLSAEDRANEEVKKFNNQNGTNYTMFEFVLNGLGKKSKKGVSQ